MKLNEQVSYLQGLADGANLTEGANGKFYYALLDTLESIALSIEELEDDFDELEEFAMSIDEDLSELEDEFYSELDWDLCDCDDAEYELADLADEEE